MELERIIMLTFFNFQDKARADELEQLDQKKIADLEKEVRLGFSF